MLTHAHIKAFKCLHDVSADLKPFNVLIGPNDSGKSSFLQALTWPGVVRSQGALHGWEHGDRLELRTDDAVLTLGRVRGEVIAHCNGTQISLQQLTKESPTFVQVSKPLMLDASVIALPSPQGSGALESLIATRGRGAAAHLARVALGNRRHYDAIQTGMRDITSGRVAEVVVGEDPGTGYPLSFRLSSRRVIAASELSQGLLMYFAFLTIVHRDDAPSVLLIEEPENGVHPLRLHEIVKLLRTLTDRGIQILMTTHSPDLLNACEPEEVLVFRRPHPESGTEIQRLPADFRERSMRATMGEIWASTGEEGLLDLLPPVDPPIKTEPGEDG